jgi:hypothetical protein
MVQSGSFGQRNQKLTRIISALRYPADDYSLPGGSQGIGFVVFDTHFTAFRFSLSSMVMLNRRVRSQASTSHSVRIAVGRMLVAIAAELRLVATLERIGLRHDGSWLQLLEVRTFSAVIIPAPAMGPDRDINPSRIGCRSTAKVQEYFPEHRNQLGFRAPPHDLRRCWNRSMGTHGAGWGSRRCRCLRLRMTWHFLRLERRPGPWTPWRYRGGRRDIQHGCRAGIGALLILAVTRCHHNQHCNCKA